MVEIDRRVQLMRACYKRCGPELYDRTTAPLSLKVCMLKAEVTETLLYGCVTWILNAKHCVAVSKRTSKSSGESLASSVGPTTLASRTPRPSRRRNARASKRPSGNGVSSSWGQSCGKTRGPVV